MNYRIILMMSGLLMMFSVYGYIMMIGAIVGENDAVFGNAIMGTVFAVLTLGVFQIAMAKRRKAHIVFNDAVTDLLKTKGCIDAQTFASTTGTSLDDARDILDKLMVQHSWRCEEHAQYNAVYYPADM